MRPSVKACKKKAEGTPHVRARRCVHCSDREERLCHMIEDQLRHLKHADSIFAVQNFLQFVVGFDESLVVRILQIVTANIIPQLCA